MLCQWYRHMCCFPEAFSLWFLEWQLVSFEFHFIIELWHIFGWNFSQFTRPDVHPLGALLPCCMSFLQGFGYSLSILPIEWADFPQVRGITSALSLPWLWGCIGGVGGITQPGVVCGCRLLGSSVLVVDSSSRCSSSVLCVCWLSSLVSKCAVDFLFSMPVSLCCMVLNSQAPYKYCTPGASVTNAKSLLAKSF